MRRADIAWTPEDMPCSAAWHWKFKVLAMPTLATHAVPSRPTITLSAKLSTFCDAMPPITGSACFMTISTRSCATPSTPSVTPKARRRLEEGGASTEEIDDETSDVVVHGWRRRSHVTEPANRAGRGSGKLALVFGREVEGLTDDEVNACDAVCAIPTGRLIESLSVSHAAVIILSQYYQSRRGGEEE
mmetsp:Transcript_3792/g.15183  ORF Transcript_3792/g.15183 Transcript_3792/m.15183 type:complete len:188 (-) Transcript_3792:2062-2625(-)